MCRSFLFRRWTHCYISGLLWFVEPSIVENCGGLDTEQQKIIVIVIVVIVVAVDDNDNDDDG